MLMRWIKTVLILPVMALVIMPIAFVHFFQPPGQEVTLAPFSSFCFWLGLALAIKGSFLSVWTVSLFMKYGNGTAAPWDPPKNFVAKGPYLHVRNPMITGALLCVAAEALLLQSLPIFAWFTLFFIGKALYIPLVEEKELAKRFGESYLTYKKNVPRWFPRLTPWQQ